MILFLVPFLPFFVSLYYVSSEQGVDSGSIKKLTMQCRCRLRNSSCSEQRGGTGILLHPFCICGLGSITCYGVGLRTVSVSQSCSSVALGPRRTSAKYSPCNTGRRTEARRCSTRSNLYFSPCRRRKLCPAKVHSSVCSSPNPSSAALQAEA